MTQVTQRGDSKNQTRRALVEVAARLLRDGGPAAVTTRAAAAAAGVQAPTIYRLFGDKDGLMDAVAEHTLATYVAAKTAPADDSDPLVALRSGWDTHIEFGLANPGVYALLVDPERARSPAAVAGLHVLAHRVHRIAVTGRLRVSERQAVELIHAAGTGTILTLIATPVEDRDPGLADAMFDTVMRSVLTEATGLAGADVVSAAVALRAVTDDLPTLTAPERALLIEWLDRVAG